MTPEVSAMGSVWYGLRGPDEPYAKGGLNMAKRENTNKHEIHLFHLRENMSRLRENICRIT